MNRVIAFAWLPLLASFIACAQVPDKDAFTQLFDGNTLTNWNVDDDRYTGRFSVQDGLLRYQARFETSGSGGGFFVRSPEPESGVGWNQVETRAMDDKLLPWNGILMRGGEIQQGHTMFDYRAANLAHAATKDWTKDWVNYEVQARGSRITIRVTVSC